MKPISATSALFIVAGLLALVALAVMVVCAVVMP